MVGWQFGEPTEGIGGGAGKSSIKGGLDIALTSSSSERTTQLLF